MSRVPLRELSLFTGQLAAMMRAAVPAMESLESLTQREQHPVLRAVLLDVQSRVRRGEGLSRAFSKHPECFDRVYVHLVAAGEARGDVPAVLDRIDRHLEFQAELQHRIRSALIYPVIVIVSALGVVLFILFFVTPTFVEVFRQFDAPIPWPTRALLAVSGLLSRFWHVGAGLLAAGAALAWRWLRVPSHRGAVDLFLLELPVVGPMVQAVVMTRLLRTLAALSQGGLPILTALELTRAAVGNKVFEDVLDDVSRQVSEGKGIASALRRSPHVSLVVSNMVATAERTGTLPQVLNRVADYYERRTETAMRDLFTALEPVFVGVLGVIVAGVALCVLLPIFNLGAVTR
ncbi:MAG: type II secretion system F family protein [Elusimicrobia bacterium]|nr:type II secretion system F family protein [Elusimicrobiota bacterium]